MGVIRDIVKSVDASDEIAAEVKEALKTLMSLAESKASVFQADIEKDLLTGRASDTLTIPITKVLQSKIEFRGTTSNTKPESVIEEITKSLKYLFVGDTSLLDGISGIVNAALSLLMGAGKGQESESKAYTVVAEYPAIVRYDFAFWCMNIEASAIYEQMHNALACVAYKSAVDVTKLDFNTFLAIYQPILVLAYGDDPKKLEEMIEQAEEIYRRFINITPHAALSVNNKASFDAMQTNLNMNTSLSRSAFPSMRELKQKDVNFAPFITHFRKMEK